jgi:dinuclear metal center YbgI/SA1388 family protein
MKISELVDLLDGIAPWRLADEWDNVGLQVGSPDRPTGKLLLALEVSAAVLTEAKALGARTLITHHPLIFDPLTHLRETLPVQALVAQMIREGMNLIVLHTNFDYIAEGPNGEIAARLEVVPRGFLAEKEKDAKGKGLYGLGLVGDLAFDTPLGQLAEAVGRALGSARASFVGAAGQRVKRVAICSGAGGEALRRWEPGVAQALITGELTHHQCVMARDRGIAVVLAGHFESEVVAMARLAMLLRKAVRERSSERIEIHVSKDETPLVTRAPATARQDS